MREFSANMSPPPKPGEVLRKPDPMQQAIDAVLVAPAPLPSPRERANQFVREAGWFVIVFPASDKHFELAEKLAKAAPGQMLPLTPDEMYLLTEFMPWPKR